MSLDTIVRRTAGPDQALHANPLVSRLLSARGVRSRTELAFSLQELPLPASLPDIDLAVSRLVAALESQQRILVIGDYDCDGATSTTLAVLALSGMGATDVSYLVPNRFEFGYGLSPEIVEVAARQQPDLIVTVDNGVASVEGVARAGKLGMDVIVTDHHLPPETLPAALAIVNPNLDGCNFPGKSLAGVGVIFYVMLALRTALREQGWFDRHNLAVPNLAELLDLVAIGTVADVVPLDWVNRTLVEQGLRRIRAGRSRAGVEALARVAGRNTESLCSSDIGFALGPRLNAAGRLDDIRTGIQCLLSSSASAATEIANELHLLNQERRSIEADMQLEAEELVKATMATLATGRQQLMSLCLSESHWHQGVIGILAGRLKEKLNIPVLVFAETEAGDLKGSGRSIPGLHIRDALQAVATTHPGLVQKFGGHAMAAGLSLDPDALATFRDAFDKEVRRQFKGVAPARQWETDGSLEPGELTLENADILRFIAPWGQGFPEPLFDGRFTVHSSRVLKDRHLKLMVSPEQSTLSVDAIAFNQLPAVSPGQSVRLVYRLAVNDFRSRRSLQLMVQYIEVAV